MYGVGYRSSPTNKKPDALACILIVPSALLLLFCGLFGIGPAINLVQEREMQQRYLLTTCLILNNTALRYPCKGACYNPAWIVRVDLPENTTAITSATNNPLDQEGMKFDEAEAKSRERRQVGSVLSCFYDSFNPNETVRFTEPAPGPELAKTVVLYIFASIGFVFLLFLLIVGLSKPAWWVRIDQKWRSLDSRQYRTHILPPPATTTASVPMNAIAINPPPVTPALQTAAPTPDSSEAPGTPTALTIVQVTNPEDAINEYNELPAGFEAIEMQTIPSSSSSSSSL